MDPLITIRRSSPADGDAILALYRAVAAIPGGLARTVDELDVAAMLAAPWARGLSLVAERDGFVLGELHASTPEPAVFAHVLGDLTIAVHPLAQGRGVGRALFTRLLAIVRDERPEVSRIELYVRESNVRGRALYESLGFVVEGRLRLRVRGVDGVLEDDLVMGWVR